MPTQGLVLLILACLLAGCATPPRSTRDAYAISIDNGGPIVVVEDPAKAFNRVGRVEAQRLNSDNVDLFVNSQHAAVYVAEESFRGVDNVLYSNTLYRLHFERVPYSLMPFYLTAGRNGGLFVIITRDPRGAPVLITTVHTCGCYLAFVPTTALKPEALPPNWPQERQNVYGESLPARLRLPAGEEYRIGVFLRSGTHRVKDIAIIEQSNVGRFNLHSAERLSMDALTRVPLPDGQMVSFFEETGARRGYVKYSFKPFELLLMSWWALDPYIGQDKQLGDPQETGTVFYTSLKPWNRHESSLWPFESFLRFWGWRL